MTGDLELLSTLELRVARDDTGALYTATNTPTPRLYGEGTTPLEALEDWTAAAKHALQFFEHHPQLAERYRDRHAGLRALVQGLPERPQEPRSSAGTPSDPNHPPLTGDPQ